MPSQYDHKLLPLWFYHSNTRYTGVPFLKWLCYQHDHSSHERWCLIISRHLTWDSLDHWGSSYIQSYTDRRSIQHIYNSISFMKINNLQSYLNAATKKQAISQVSWVPCHHHRIYEWLEYDDHLLDVHYLEGLRDTKFDVLEFRQEVLLAQYEP